MNYFEYPEEYLVYVLREMGKAVKINGTCARALMNNSKINLHTDYRHMISIDKVQRGDLITWDNESWLVLSEVAQKRYTYYRSEIRKCNFTVNFVIDELVKPMACIIDSVTTDKLTNRLFEMPDGKMVITLPNNDLTEKIEVNHRIVKFNTAWRVYGHDFTEDGLIKLFVERQLPSEKDDMVNEIPDGLDLNYAIIINNSETELAPGATLQINAVVTLNSRVADKPLSFAVDNEELATIDSNGLLTAIDEGNVTITATMADNPTIMATIIVTITDTPASVTELVINGPDSIIKGKTGEFTVTKLVNGIEQPCDVDFYLTGDNLPASAFTLTKVTNNVCTIKCNEVLYHVTLTATEDELTAGKAITLKGLF